MQYLPVIPRFDFMKVSTFHFKASGRAGTRSVEPLLRVQKQIFICFSNGRIKGLWKSIRGSFRGSLKVYLYSVRATYNRNARPQYWTPSAPQQPQRRCTLWLLHAPYDTWGACIWMDPQPGRRQWLIVKCHDFTLCFGQSQFVFKMNDVLVLIRNCYCCLDIVRFRE